MAWRSLVWLLRVALLLVLLAVLGAAALAWRLSQGPLDIAWLARRIEANAFPADAPAHLAFGAATIAWDGFRYGADGALHLSLEDVRLVDTAEATDASLRHLELSVSALRLLQARIEPRALRLDGLRLGAERTDDGAIRVHLPGLENPDPAPDTDVDAPSLTDILSELRRPARRDGPGRTIGLVAQLRQVELHDAELTLRDLPTGRTLRVTLPTLDLQRQPNGGVTGAADGTLLLQPGSPGAVATLHLAANLLPGGGTHLALTVAPAPAGAIAQVDPALASLSALDADLGATASLDLGPDMLPRTGALHVAANSALLTLPGVGIRFDRLAVDADATWPAGTWRPDRIQLHRALAVIGSARGAWSTTLSATGDAGRHEGRVDLQLDLTLDHLDVADLPALWPVGVGVHVRPWLTENLTSGTLHAGTAHLVLAAPENDWGAVDITAATGSLDGDDVTLHWLRPVPPLEHVAAHLTFASPDEIDVAMTGGAQAGLALHDGTVRFTSLQSKDQDMSVVTTIDGPVPDALALLKNPRLHLFDRHPLPVKSSAGTLSARLSLSMPMKQQVRADQLKIGVQGTLANLKLGGLVAGRDLDHGDLRFEVTEEGMKASGTAQIGTIPIMLTHEMDFRAGGPDQVLQRSAATGHATGPQLRAAGVDPGGVVEGGEIGLAATYTQQRGGDAQVDLKADFARAALELLGWVKPVGPAASGHAVLDLKDEHLEAISDVDLHGPALDIVGRADMVGGRPLLLRFSVIEVGPTRAAGEVRLPARPGDPIRASLRGTVLDLAPQLSAMSSTKPGPPAGTARGAWSAEIHFDRVILGGGRTFLDVTARAEDDGNRLTLLDLSTGGREKLRAIVAPQGQGRRLSIRAEDAGAVFQALDVTSSVAGGRLAVEASFDDRLSYSPLAGTLDITDFEVKDAVAVGKLLQAITVYGVMDAMRGQGVQFSRLYLPFRYDRHQIHVGEARAFSASLGLTARGWIDLARKQMDLRGTIVPAYAVNSALGRIPLIGRIFSPERGGGFVAVNYSVTGNASDPSVIVNPLSALTPGFLRGLFSIFG